MVRIINSIITYYFEIWLLDIYSDHLNSPSFFKLQH